MTHLIPEDDVDDDEQFAAMQESPEYEEFLETMQEDLAWEKSQDQDADNINWP